MKDFDFDLKFRISFSMQEFYKGEPLEKKARGSKLTDEMKTIVRDFLKDLQSFYNIIAKGPDGKVRQQLWLINVKLN